MFLIRAVATKSRNTNGFARTSEQIFLLISWPGGSWSGSRTAGSSHARAARRPCSLVLDRVVSRLASVSDRGGGGRVCVRPESACVFLIRIDVNKIAPQCLNKSPCDAKKTQ